MILGYFYDNFSSDKAVDCLTSEYLTTCYSLTSVNHFDDTKGLMTIVFFKFRGHMFLYWQMWINIKRNKADGKKDYIQIRIIIELFKDWCGSEMYEVVMKDLDNYSMSIVSFLIKWIKIIAMNH